MSQILQPANTGPVKTQSGSIAAPGIRKPPAGNRTASTRSSTRHPRLHDERSIGLGCFLGTPVLGGALFAHNLYKLARPGQALMAILAGVLATAALIVIGLNMPGNLRTGCLIPFVVSLIFQKIAKRKFQFEYAMIKNGHAKAYSVWISAGIALSITLALVALVIAGV